MNVATEFDTTISAARNSILVTTSHNARGQPLVTFQVLDVSFKVRTAGRRESETNDLVESSTKDILNSKSSVCVVL